MKSKNGESLLGPTLGLSFVTIAIIIILVVFALGSAVVREIDKSEAGLKVYGLVETELNNLKIYMESYKALLEKTFLEAKNE